MLNWYSEFTLAERATLLLLIGVFCLVMYRCFRSLTGSHLHTTWYHGIHTTPIFQALMWLGAVPLIIPAIILYYLKQRSLAAAHYIGNYRTRIFHTRNCEYQQRISSDLQRCPLDSIEQASRYRFKPCNWWLHCRSSQIFKNWYAGLTRLILLHCIP